MFELDMKSRKAISDQIIENMKELIVSGVLQTGEKVPSVRELAGQLLVNPNTVQKAYRILEAQGYIYTVRGRGNFVCDTAALQPQQRDLQEAEEQLRDSISRLYHLGMSRSQAEEILKRLFDERGDWK